MAIDNQFLKVPKQYPATIEYGIIYSTTDEREKIFHCEFISCLTLIMILVKKNISSHSTTMFEISSCWIYFFAFFCLLIRRKNDNVGIYPQAADHTQQ